MIVLQKWNSGKENQATDVKLTKPIICQEDFQLVDQQTQRNLPLKFGLILASYPDVLPINLSKKSEGDRVCEGDFPDLESCSLQKAALNKLLATISDDSALIAFMFREEIIILFKKIFINIDCINEQMGRKWIRKLYFRSENKFQVKEIYLCITICSIEYIRL